MKYPRPFLCHFWHKDECCNPHSLFGESHCGIEYCGGHDDEFDPQQYLFVFRCKRCERMRYVISTHSSWPFTGEGHHMTRAPFPEELSAIESTLGNMI